MGDYNPSFLHRHMMAGSRGLIFDPSWQPGNPTIDGLAFALYDFRVAGFEGNPALNYGLTPLTVNFDATGSSDPDSTVAGYKWDHQGDGTSWVDLSPTAASPPQWTVSDTTTATTDPIDFSFNRDADDGDTLVYFSP